MPCPAKLAVSKGHDLQEGRLYVGASHCKARRDGGFRAVEVYASWPGVAVRR